jgi:hypothetical protein
MNVSNSKTVNSLRAIFQIFSKFLIIKHRLREQKNTTLKGSTSTNPLLQGGQKTE